MHSIHDESSVGGHRQYAIARLDKPVLGFHPGEIHEGKVRRDDTSNEGSDAHGHHCHKEQWHPRMPPSLIPTPATRTMLSLYQAPANEEPKNWGSLRYPAAIWHSQGSPAARSLAANTTATATLQRRVAFHRCSQAVYGIICIPTFNALIFIPTLNACQDRIIWIVLEGLQTPSLVCRCLWAF